MNRMDRIAERTFPSCESCKSCQKLSLVSLSVFRELVVDFNAETRPGVLFRTPSNEVGRDSVEPPSTQQPAWAKAEARQSLAPPFSGHFDVVRK